MPHRAKENGLRLALFGVVGVAAANAVYFAVSATGIAALLIASNTIFATINGVGFADMGLAVIFSATGGIIVRWF